MTEFIPLFSERETEELIEIAHASPEYWQRDAFDQAKNKAWDLAFEILNSESDP